MANYLTNLEKTKEIYNQYDLNTLRNGYFIVSDKKLIPAESVFIEEELQRLYKLRRDKYLSYDLLKDKIIYADNPSLSKQEFTKIYEEINDIQNNIDNIYTYYDSLNIDTISQDEIRLKTLYREIQNDKTLIPTYIKAYIKFMKPKPKPEPITYLIKTIPKIYNSKEAKALEKPKAPEKPKEIKETEKVKKPKIKEQNVKIIKNNIKDLIKDKFRAKNIEECKSKQRSKEYFMKKDEILDIIDKNPELKNLLPANYKTLDKENLCRYIFS
jgi:predicted transcriptional regulator